MQETYIGIDIAKDKFDVAILKNDSLILNFNNIIYKQFSNNENGFKKFTSYLKENGIESAVLAIESTGTYHVDLADFLYKNKYTVYILNPYKVKNFALGSHICILKI